MEVTDTTQEKMVAIRVRVAQRFLQRVRGLIGAPKLLIGEALLLPRCQGVHTFGMRYDIDVLYLGGDGNVIGLSRALPPNRIGPVFMKARAVLELPRGTIDRLHIGLDDQLEFTHECG